jgi:hypothetical protein
VIPEQECVDDRKAKHDEPQTDGPGFYRPPIEARAVQSIGYPEPKREMAGQRQPQNSQLPKQGHAFFS